MRALQEIEQEADQKTIEARRAGLQPYIAKHDHDEGVKQAPVVGHYIPAGWSPTRRFFVDSSGFGSEGEGALTFGQFLQEVTGDKAYAITEAGQFQVYIQEFIR